MTDTDRTMMIVAPDSPPFKALVDGGCDECGWEIIRGETIRRRFYWGGRTVIVHDGCCLCYQGESSEGVLEECPLHGIRGTATP